MLIGCGSASMTTTEFDSDGNITSIHKVKYSRFGSGELKAIEVDIQNGTAKIGEQKGNAGKLAETALNLSEVAKSLIKP